MAKSLFENELKKIKKEDNSAEQSKTAENFSAQNKEDTQKSTDEDLLAREEVYAESRKDSTGLLSVKNSSPKSLFEKMNVDLSAKYRKYDEKFLNKETAKALDELISDISKRDVDESWVQDVYEMAELVKEQKAAVKKLLENLPILENLQSEVPNVLLAIEKQKAEKKRLDDIKAAEAERLKIGAINKEIQDIIERIDVLSETKITAKWVDKVLDIEDRIDELPSWASEKILAAKKIVADEIFKDARYYEQASQCKARAKNLVNAKNKNLAWANRICDFDFDLSCEVSDLLTKIVDGYDDCLSKAYDMLNAEDKRIKKEKAEKEAAKEAERQRRLQEEKQTNQEIAKISEYLSAVKTGDTITFGSYAPCGTEEKKPLEWIVVSSDKEGLFLLSKFVIETYKTIAAAYPNVRLDRPEEFSWGSCSVREWLNDKFLHTAFSEAERWFLQYFISCSEPWLKHNKNDLIRTTDRISIPGVYDYKTNPYVYAPKIKETKKNLAKSKKAEALTEIADDQLIAKRKGSSHPRRVFYLTRDAAMKKRLIGNRTYYLKVYDYNGKLRKFDVRDKNFDLLGVRPIIKIKR